MELINANQSQAARQTLETLQSAESIVRDAQSLHRLTEDILSRFDGYISEIREFRGRDESFDKRAAELLSDLVKQNQSLSLLMDKLSRRVESMSSPGEKEKTDLALSEIQKLTGSLNDSVRSISDTLAALSEEV